MTENVTDVEPCGTVTDEGTIAAAGDAPRLIVAPAVGAGAEKEIVQLVPADGSIVIGLQEKPFKLGPWSIVTDAPDADIAMGWPVASDVVPLVSCRAEEVLAVEVAIDNETEASTPLEITASLRPQTKHVIAPGLLLQFRDMFAAASPGVHVAAEKSVVE